MTPRLPVLSYRKLARLPRSHGFTPVRQRGSHVTWADNRGHRIVVPNHSGETISRGLLADILERAGIDADEVRR